MSDLLKVYLVMQIAVHFAYFLTIFVIAPFVEWLD